MDAVKLIGLDFGTTTSSAVIASAQLLRNSVTGRTEPANVRECYRSEIVFTPFCGNHLDLQKLADYLNAWLTAGGVQPEEIFGGGALLTGLAARKENAAELVCLIRRRLGEALIATADDPCLEAWLAFMGSCARLSREHPDKWFLNLDIGGGTTNLALGRNGEVVSTGCLLVGTRHIQVVPGTYRLVELSRYARCLLDHLGIRKGPGEELLPAEVETIIDFYLLLLEAVVSADHKVIDEPVARLHQQVAFRPRFAFLNSGELVVTLSGGVGELVYGAAQGKPLPSTTYFGDLGIDLAARLLRASPWADDFRKYAPAGGGRATVYGLLRHSTQVSGSTLFLPDATCLPLRDIPILGTISDDSSESQLGDLFELVQKSSAGGAVRIHLADRSSAGVRALGTRISETLRARQFPAHHPLIVLVGDNIGKALGQYISQWGALAVTLAVIDEIAVPDAQYVHLGPLHNQVIPVSFHGLQA